MKATIYNNFHNSRATVLVKKGRVSVGAMRNAAKKLCGDPNCTCGPIRGPQDFTIEYLNEVDGYRVLPK